MPPPARPKRSGISLSTLAAAAIASVVAAVVVSRLWQAGTLMATAMTPVIIALVKEAIERPAQRVSSMAPRGLARTARAVAPPPPEADAPPPPVHDQGLSEMRVYGRERAASGRRWKLAVLTGLLAFVVCVAVLTVPELLAGRSVVNRGNDTTLFGGRRQVTRSNDKTDTTTTDTHKTTTTQTTPTPSQTTTTPTTTTTTPQQTTTPTAPTQTTPTPTPAPTTTAPAPSQTTPAPPAGSGQTTPTTP